MVGAGLGAFVAAQHDNFAATARELHELIARGLRPIIGETLPLDRGPEALHRLERRAARPKIVLTIGAGDDAGQL